MSNKQRKVKDVREKEGGVDKATKKVMDGVAKFLHSNAPKKKVLVKREHAEYFYGSKAIDSLLTSKWARDKPEEDDTVTPYFPDREACKRFCDRLLSEGYFAHGSKVKVQSKTKKSDEKEDESDGTPTSTPKKKTKYRLLHHEHQVFIDSPDEIFIWIYSPPSKTTYFYGILVLVGAVAATLYPLWPDTSRIVISYLSTIGLVLVGILLGLYLVRWLLYALIWLVTYGNITFWLLPNLDADMGVIESFQPLYSIKRKKRAKRKKVETKEAKQEEKTTEMKQSSSVADVDSESKEDECETNDHPPCSPDSEQPKDNPL